MSRWELKMKIWAETVEKKLFRFSTTDSSVACAWFTYRLYMWPQHILLLQISYLPVVNNMMCSIVLPDKQECLSVEGPPPTCQ